MMPDEREAILALFAREENWCQSAEAKNQRGEPVRYDDPSAVAWDLTGALCRLFGWRRACELFCQLDRHLHGRRFASWQRQGQTPEIAAMVAIQEFNDREDTTFETVVAQIETLTVWRGQPAHARGT